MKMDMRITGIEDVKKVLMEIGPREAKNLMRTTVQGVAGHVARDAKKNAPVDDGDLKKGIKAKRERGERDVLHSTVRASPFYWRYLEYGQGPDGVEHAFFLRALQELRPDMNRVYLEIFVKKLQARLARERKRMG